MGTKNSPGRFDCYAAAAPDEPMFVLLARDPDASALVLLWAAMRRLRAAERGDLEKIVEAEGCAESMIQWLVEHKGREPSGIATLSRALAVMAELNGAVVTIDQEPLQPLAMVHFRHRVEVRAKRSVWGDEPAPITLAGLKR